MKKIALLVLVIFCVLGIPILFVAKSNIIQVTNILKNDETKPSEYFYPPFVLIVPKQKTIVPKKNIYDNENNAYNLSDLVNGQTIFHVWATTCAPCLEELPRFNEFAAKFEAQGGRVIYISNDRAKDKEKAQIVFKKYVNDNRKLYFDEYATNTFSAIGIPLSVFYNPDKSEFGRTQGIIKFSNGNFVNKEDYF